MGANNTLLINTPQDVLEWDLVQTMLEAGEIESNDVKEVVHSLGLAKMDRIDIDSFERIIDALLELTGRENQDEVGDDEDVIEFDESQLQ